MYQHTQAELTKLLQDEGSDKHETLNDVIHDMNRMIQTRLAAIQIYQDLAGCSVAPDLVQMQHKWASLVSNLAAGHPLVARLFQLSRFELNTINFYMLAMLAIAASNFKDAVLHTHRSKSELAVWRTAISTGHEPNEIQMPRLFSWAQLAHQALLAKLNLYFSKILTKAEVEAGGSFHAWTARCNPDFTEMIDNYATHADVSVLVLRESVEGESCLEYSCAPGVSDCSGLQQWPIIFSSSHRALSHWEDRDHLPNIVSLVSTMSQQLAVPHLQCVVCHHEPDLAVSYCIAQVEERVILTVISTGKLDPDDHGSIQDFMRYMLIRLRHLHVFAQLRSNSVSNTSIDTTS
eukprot:TRINITY_DN3280_c0_g1_i1.p1 TRINITY_DN3280_c0_g1~~TRINITY_DN3280_c0_g1_i1.p1  ORF type:complete len:348 (+),score=41.40 TRINITY_DN3280_c0_g1_i1:209-1252(+)